MTCENATVLGTERLIIRKFTTADVEALFEILSDTVANTYLPWFPAKNLEEAEIFLQERFLEYYSRSFLHRYAICMRKDNRPIGYVWLSDDESNDLGYGLKRGYWNRGIVTEAAGVVVGRIKNAGYGYITATHDRNNVRSGAVMRKLGMTYKYSFLERWQPKDIPVTFRMYQLNFGRSKGRTYMGYWDKYENHFVEETIDK